MAFLSQRYLSHLLNKLVNVDLGLGYELHYSDPSFFKYYINMYKPNKDSDNKLIKRTTIMILEVESFNLIMNVKSKSINESEYMGTFATNEVNLFTIDFADAILLSLK